MSHERARRLLTQYKDGTCTDAEKALVEQWLFHYNDAQPELSDDEIVLLARAVWAELPAEAKRPVKRLPVWGRVAAAAAVVLALGAGLYLFTRNPRPAAPSALVLQDIAPGSNKAVLTLAGGRQVVLNDSLQGQLAQQGNAVISLRAGGALTYQPTNAGNAPALVYNTLTTPRGGNYKVVLEDGTAAWLNAASSITYPARFSGNSREVSITGEVYFEVAQNAAKPFLVKAGSQTVQVLGTHFDINAYADEPAVKTTLLEGSVRVNTATGNALIAPGQQAVLAAGNLQVVAADVEDVMAWKAGMFRFDGESLESVMRKLSRWYDVEIEYQDPAIKNMPLTGIINHFNNVSTVLHMLELTREVRFRVAGKKIIVMRT